MKTQGYFLISGNITKLTIFFQGYKIKWYILCVHYFRVFLWLLAVLVIASWNSGTNTGKKMLTDPLFKMLRSGIPGFPSEF
jgi:hypothetical protein